MPSFLKEVPIMTDFLICQIPLSLRLFDSTGRGFIAKNYKMKRSGDLVLDAEHYELKL